MKKLQVITCGLLLTLVWLAPATAAAPREEPTSGTPEVAFESEPLVVTSRGVQGGRLVVALGAEPRTLNPLLATDRPSFTVARRLHGSLARIDGLSHREAPALATSWQVLDAGRRLRVQLRRGVRFSDGDPFDAEDVVFTFQVYIDPQVGSPNRDLLMVGGKPVEVLKIDDHTVDFVFAAPYAVGARLLDGIAILPSHLLRQAYREQRLSKVWGLSAEATDVVGLGPFRFVRYLPGERLELERNPHYWKRDTTNQRLPYLDRLTFVFIPGKDGQAPRFESGEIHLVSPLSSESFSQLEASRRRQQMVLSDLGPGLAYSFLFFNLNPLDGKNLPSIERKQQWFQQKAFRQAVSLAIDRQSLTRLAYRGKATAIASHVTSGNKLWIHRGLPVPKRSLESSRRLLSEAGFSWRPDGRLIDSQEQAVDFTLVTSSSNAQRLAMATLIEQDLAQLGIALQVVPLEFRALIDRLTQSFDYEACLLALGGGDVDPNSTMNVWMSQGGNHLWHLGQDSPATPWEAEIDRLLNEQLVTPDPVRRKALYDRMQEIVAEQVPFIFLVSPNILVGARQEVGNFAPSILGHPTLWNADTLYLRPAPQ